MEVFRKYVDPDHLMVQLSMIPNLIKSAFADNITIKKVTNVRTIADAMNQNEIYKGIVLNEVDKLLRIYFTFPFTSATAERSFSSLRRIKTFLRSSMTQCRLNNLFMLYVHTSKQPLQRKNLYPISVLLHYIIRCTCKFTLERGFPV